MSTFGAFHVRKSTRLSTPSLIPRPSQAPVFDHLQYAKTEPECSSHKAIGKSGSVFAWSKTGAGEGLGTRLLHAYTTSMFAFRSVGAYCDCSLVPRPSITANALLVASTAVFFFYDNLCQIAKDSYIYKIAEPMCNMHPYMCSKMWYVTIRHKWHW